ncbi:aspartate--tRNA ligase [Alicyclobacillus cycloheptanicus]|uniref:Aspartate--tRNA ligase n=1 Tax=Alicyclobacillus cycloheptanicus TaxID=1457 RepID=A0ABT9XE79_9BACL|nr:aspartate--tRNA ligase [Alicyclobacillus cycloheptanicus]MDQ0188601.1 aspartyl-tRNA synthetase [Alicyclobacillus cycloheptanicus]WDM00716.1 aspartate--tRNA ligase [Alicyclobacillus cycloheptanicus]
MHRAHAGQPVYERTHWVQDTVALTEGVNVALAGWVQRRRDLGNLIFIDLRDRTGIVQLVFDRDRGTSGNAMRLAETLRNEYVITARGTVAARSPETVNPRIETGRIEVVVSDLEVLNEAKNPPFYIQDGIDVDENVRLRHRYLDLRRPEMQKMLMLRHKVYRAFRNFLDDHGFVEVETPILTRSTPEGARDYIVPSRLQPGEFYALPQSPQLFKQLLMVSGLERYYQIARCFRDEDLRADRQPEFSQLDIETSFLSMDDLLALMEQMFAAVFRETLGIEIATPFQRLTYQEAMERYGSDKPDLRFDLPIVDLSEAVRGSRFAVFENTLASGGVVKAIVAPGCADYSRKQTDELSKLVAPFGLKGVAPIAIGEESFRSPIAKFFTPEQLQRIVEAAGAKVGDLILIAAAPRKVALQALGALRLKLGETLGLIDADAFRFAWVVDFPLFSYDEELGRYVPEHHPFTMPKWEDLDKLESDQGAVRAQAYDLVLNGFELSSGSMRIYRRDIQERMFAALGYTPEAAQEKFGFLLNAFEYGTPPHGGIAFGLDRLVMLMGKGKSLRDCIAFPKTSSATDLMMDAPSAVSPEQLEILKLQVKARG